MSSWLLSISKGGNSTPSLGSLCQCLVTLTVRRRIGVFWCSFLLCAHCLLHCHWVPLSGAWLSLLDSSLQLFMCIGEISAPEPFLLQAKQFKLSQPFLIAEILKFHLLWTTFRWNNFEYKLTTCLSCFHCFCITLFWSLILKSDTWQCTSVIIVKIHLFR